MTSVHRLHGDPRGTGPDGPASHVLPTAEDPLAMGGSEALGGPPGRRLLLTPGWWTPVRVLIIAATLMFALGMVEKLPCYSGGWFHGATSQYTHACYSDIPHLFSGRGFADGQTPYFDRIKPEVSGGMDYLEYPVLTGAFMQVAAWLTPGGGGVQHREQLFWFMNASLLLVCALVVVVAVSRTHRLRPWDAALVALAPAFTLNATINWDLFAVALTAVALWLWARRHPLGAGVFIGLATAAKFYPVLLLGPLLVLCLRAGRMRAFGRALSGAIASWLIVNAPIMLFAPEGWSKFYTFSQERGEDYGSFWLIIMQQRGKPLEHLNSYAMLIMALVCLGLAALALYAPRRPRLPQLAFLVIAAFILSNKVYSPQYVLWLIPLAALARPRWRDFLIWQAAEIMYFLGIWLYLAGTLSDKHQGLPEGGYHAAVIIHLLGTLYLCAMVIRDMLHPHQDPVRRDDADDPSGGVLDQAPDCFVLRRSPGQHAHHPDTTEPAAGTYVHWGTRTASDPGAP